jgi:hypothetical protein
VCVCVCVFPFIFRSKTHRHKRQVNKPQELTMINNNIRPIHNSHPQVTINPQHIETDHVRNIATVNYLESNLVSTPASMHRTPMHRSPWMASSRSITSACTGLSYLPNDTPRSVRYNHRKTPTTGIFSDSESAARTRSRRPTRHMGSPYINTNTPRHQQSYATLTLKRPDGTLHYEPSRKIYDNTDKLSTNENLREFIQVLDSLAQEKFGVTDMHTTHFDKDLTMASSPTETNESITLDSGYQSTKQLMNNDDYAVVIKAKLHQTNFCQRQRHQLIIKSNNSVPKRISNFIFHVLRQ